MANRKFTDELKASAVELYKSGMSMLEVSDLTGISEPYVKTIVKKAGVPRRPPGFQPGNRSRTGNPHSEFTKRLIRDKHLASGHSQAERQSILVSHDHWSRAGVIMSKT